MAPTSPRPEGVVDMPINKTRPIRATLMLAAFTGPNSKSYCAGKPKLSADSRSAAKRYLNGLPKLADARAADLPES
jgi:hypothetical protein